jgi:hypothetical protein
MIPRLGIVGTACFAMACAEAASTPLQSTPASDGGIDATSDAVATSPEASIAVDAGSQDSFTEAPTLCSNDLRSVLDGEGNLVAECAPDQGCAKGECVPACEAAELGRGSFGCEFLVPTPVVKASWADGAGVHFGGVKPPCFAVVVTNNWETSAALTVERGADSFDVTSFGRLAQASGSPDSWPPVPATGLPPGEVAVLFLSHHPQSQALIGGESYRCPIEPAVHDLNVVVPAASTRQAWRVRSSAPITLFDLASFGAQGLRLTGASLVYPISTFSTNVVAVGPPEGAAVGGTTWPRWAQLVAREDGTQVQLLASTDFPAAASADPALSLPAIPKNTVGTVTLDAGEYLQWHGIGEAAGTVIQSNKPVSWVGGHAALSLGSATSVAYTPDSDHEHSPPLSALASEYVAAPYTSRRLDGEQESVAYRIVGAVDGTQLSFDPPLAFAPSKIDAREVADFEATGAFVVESQDGAHPFHLAQLMPSCDVAGGSNGPTCAQATTTTLACLGDPEHLNVVPPRQFLTHYAFYSDSGYHTTELVFIRSKTATGFIDVELDCLGNVTGWKPVGSSGEHEVASLFLTEGGQSVGACGDGPHRATSNGPFSVAVWGLACHVSYAYQAGGNLAALNDIVVPVQ